MNKHSDLLRKFVNYDLKNFFITFPPDLNYFSETSSNFHPFFSVLRLFRSAPVSVFQLRLFPPKTSSTSRPSRLSNRRWFACGQGYKQPCQGTLTEGEVSVITLNLHIKAACIVEKEKIVLVQKQLI
jgi:hypothetical protein